MDTRSRARVDSAPRVDAEEARSVARYFARERQKRELRRVRDAVVLSLAGQLGERELARCMGVSEGVVARLVTDAGDSLDGSSPPVQSPIAARRLADSDRWADADRHYEELASGPRITARRRTPPPA